MHRMAYRWFGGVGLSAMAVVLCCGSAHAQYALGDGRGLDANLRFGSGGSNGGGRDAALSGRIIPGRYADAVVTGSVGGLSRFRGDLGYRAAGDFSATTGSDDLHLFNLRSSPVGLSGRSSGLIYRRPGSGVTAADLSRTGQDRIVRPDATAGDVARPDAKPQFGAFPQRARSETDAEARRGRLLELGVAPLTGLTGQGVDQASEDDPLGAYFRARVDELDPSAALHLNARLGDSELLDGTVLIGDLSRRAEAAAFQSPGLGKVTEGEDSYFDLLRRLGGNRQSPRPSARVDPAKRRPVEATGRATTVSQRISEALRQSSSEAKGVGKPGRPVPTLGINPPVGAPKAPATRVEKFEYNFPPIKSLAGSVSSPFNKVMKDAESSLRAGKYFQAEHLYGRALLLRSGHPMAQAGRVHAQIGSGLYLSAAHNLRRLLAGNAVVVPVRYDKSLLPNSDRLELIRQTLRLNIREAKRAEALRRRRYTERGLRPTLPTRPRTGSSLLLAYLAYQAQDDVSCRLALDDLTALDPGDSLEPMLRTQWISEKQLKPAAIPAAP
jgi:hypothetical protein